MRISWLFGDGQTQYTHVDPAWRRPGETEAEQFARIIRVVGPKQMPNSQKLDGSDYSPAEYAAYVAALGDGAKAVFAGVISDDEYMAKRERLRAYRAAWTWTTNDPFIDIDLDKSREIHKNILRLARAPVLAKLDVEMTRAYKEPPLQDEIEAKRQVLRDITDHPGIAAAKSIDDLKAVTLPKQ